MLSVDMGVLRVDLLDGREVHAADRGGEHLRHTCRTNLNPSPCRKI